MKSIKLILLFLAMSSAVFAQTNTLRVWMDESLEMTADGSTVTYLTVSENDPNNTYTSFSMTILLPEGVSINQKRSGREYVNDIEMSVRASSSHVIECNMPDVRTLKIIGYSSQNADLYSDDIDGNPLDELFTIGLKCSPSAINGEYRIELLGDCVFAKKEADGNITGEYLEHIEYCTMTVVGGMEFGGVDYTLSDLGYGTMIMPFDCEIPSGIKVYECAGVADDKTVMNRVEMIAANTPYIVRGTGGTYHLDGTYKALKTSYATEYMTGVFEEKSVPVGSYVMQNHPDTHGVGFYLVGDVPETITPYRCYLNVLTSGAKALAMTFNEETGIEDKAVAGAECVNVYNVHGICIKQDVRCADALNGLPAGVYVVNGKKMVVK